MKDLNYKDIFDFLGVDGDLNDDELLLKANTMASLKDFTVVCLFQGNRAWFFDVYYKNSNAITLAFLKDDDGRVRCAVDSFDLSCNPVEIKKIIIKDGDIYGCS